MLRTRFTLRNIVSVVRMSVLSIAVLFGMLGILELAVAQDIMNDFEKAANSRGCQSIPYSKERKECEDTQRQIKKMCKEGIDCISLKREKENLVSEIRKAEDNLAESQISKSDLERILASNESGLETEIRLLEEAKNNVKKVEDRLKEAKAKHKNAEEELKKVKEEEREKKNDELKKAKKGVTKAERSLQKAQSMLQAGEGRLTNVKDLEVKYKQKIEEKEKDVKMKDQQVVDLKTYFDRFEQVNNIVDEIDRIEECIKWRANQRKLFDKILSMVKNVKSNAGNFLGDKASDGDKDKIEGFAAKIIITIKSGIDGHRDQENELASRKKNCEEVTMVKR